MKKSILLLFTFFTFGLYSNVLAQSFSCNTNQVADCYDVANTGCYDELVTMNEEGPFSIKIYVHAVRRSGDCSGGADYEDLVASINHMREPFIPHNIYFLWDCVVNDICNSDWYNTEEPWDDLGDFICDVAEPNGNFNEDGIDIYLFPDDIDGSEIGEVRGAASSMSIGSGSAILTHGRSNESSDFNPGDGNNFTTFVPIRETHVLAHEMGHCLGLLHTHANSALSNGDCISDTPNDPNLSTQVNLDCEYEGTSQNDGIEDLVRNIMSWSNRECLEYFTEGQGQRMRNMMTFENPNFPEGVLVQSSNVANEVIESNIVWSEDRNINGILEIKDGGTLTINPVVTVRFAQDAKFITYPGGRLNLYGTLTSNSCANVCGNSLCEDVWEGIRMVGQSLQTQTFSNQPVVKGYPGSEISNAETAIRVYGRNLLTSGGIVHCTQTVFRNNRIATDFAPYAATNNSSFFRRCEFINNNQYHLSSPFDSFVKLIMVNGINFYGCKFENTQSNHVQQEYHDFGYGIKSYASGFDVLPACLTFDYPCPSYERSVFTGLSYGIFNYMAFNSSRAYKIISADFTDNNTGVYVNSEDNGTILHNVFNLGTVPNPNLFPEDSVNQIGLMFENDMGGFTFEQNEFIGTSGGNTDAMIGSVCKNLGRFNNIVRQNDYINTDYANLALGENAIAGDARGLHYLCNDNIGSTTYDLYASNEEGDVTIRTEQGEESSINTNTYFSTGNVHSDSPTCTDLRNDGSLMTYHYFNVAAQTPFSVFGNIELKDDAVENECPETYCEPPCRTDSEITTGKNKYYTERNQRETAKTEIEAAELAGNTELSELKKRQAAAHQSRMDKEAFMTVLHMVSDTLGYDADSLNLWLENLDLFSTYMFFTMQEQAAGNIATAEMYMQRAGEREDLTARELKTLHQMPDLLKVITNKTPQKLSAFDLRCLKGFAEDENSFVGNISRNLLRTRGYDYPPVINLTDKADERFGLSKQRIINDVITVFPNPVKENLFIELPKGEKEGIFSIVDLNGTIILTKKVSQNRFSVEVMNLRSGIYFYRYASAAGSLKTGKIIIQ